MDKITKPPVSLISAMGINSFASLMFETILLKQLNFLIGSWSYIASIVLCSFILGSGIGVLLAQVNKSRISYNIIAILQGISVIITSLLLLKSGIIFKVSNNLFLFGLVLSPTFILFGYLFITILNQVKARLPNFIQFIYSADLIGAALGGVSTAFIAFPLFGINKTIILCTLLFLISAIFFDTKIGLKKYKIIYLIATGLALILFLNVDPWIEKQRDVNNTPLYKILQDNGKLLYTGWSPLQRIDIVKMQDGFIIAYDGFPWTSFGLPENLSSVESMINSLGPRFMKALYPFIHNPKHILVIGVGAGPDVFYANKWLNKMAINPENPGSITGIEIDPLVVSLLKNKFKYLNNNIFNNPSVQIIVDDGRHFTETTSKRYDLIHYPGVDTPFAFSSAYGVNPYLRAENYLYTLEGLNSAYDQLSEDGALLITVGSWFSEPFAALDVPAKMRTSINREARLISTLKAILEKKGIKKWEDYIEVAGYGFSHGVDNSMLEVIIKVTKKPIDPDLIRQMIKKYNIRYPVYFPDKDTIKKLSDKYAPITDDQPFYYNFPLTVIPAIISKQLMPISFLIIFYLVYGLIYLKLKNQYHNFKVSGLLFLFFICIGISFMIAELLYVQQAIIFLRNSFLATAVLISLILAFSGIGSIYANVLYDWKNKLFFVLILAPLYNLLLPHIISLVGLIMNNASVYCKTILLAIIIFPLGFLLGAFFPMGFLLSIRLEPKINFSWLYSIDILGSILGILIGICLPIKMGYVKSIHYLSYLLFIQVILVFWLQRLSISNEQNS